MKTKHEIEYRTIWSGTFIIPPGTKVIPATNISRDGWYWAEPWPGMDEIAESWHRNYGFLISEDEVTE